MKACFSNTKHNFLGIKEENTPHLPTLAVLLSANPSAKPSLKSHFPGKF
jgi:hypothetical protein